MSRSKMKTINLLFQLTDALEYLIPLIFIEMNERKDAIKSYSKSTEKPDSIFIQDNISEHYAFVFNCTFYKRR